MRAIKTTRSQTKIPRIVTKKKYRAKSELALSETRGIQAELIQKCLENGWAFTNSEFTFVLKSPQEFVIFYSRRSGLLQNYYLGGGTHTMEKHIDDFQNLADLLLWIAECADELKDKPRESQDMDRSPEPAKTSIGVSLRDDKYRVVVETPDGLKIIGRYDTFLEAAAAYQNHLELSRGLDE
jgi:hypothetical protein